MENVKEKTIFRTPERSQYLATLRTIPQNKQLSYEAAGMLWYLLSKPDDWQVIINDLKRKDCGRDKAYRILKELMDAGHIRRERVKTQDNLTTLEYRVYENPLPENPDTGKPNISPDESAVSQDTEKPTLHNSDSTETLQKDSAPATEPGAGENSDDQKPPEQPTLEKSPAPDKIQRPRNLIFDAVAEHVFGYDEIERDHLSKEDGGQIGVISAWLAGTSDRWTPRDRNGKALKPIIKGFISAPAKPEHIKEFSEDWKSQPGELHMPLTFEAFVTHWRAWASAKRKAAVKIKTITNTASPAPPPQLTEEEIRQRVRDLAEARERQSAARRQGAR